MNNLKAINERYIQDIDDEDDEIVTSDITKHYDKNFRISVSVKKCTADDFVPSMEYIKEMLDDIFDVYFELDGYETVLLAQDNANDYELVEINERNCKKFFDIKQNVIPIEMIWVDVYYSGRLRKYIQGERFLKRILMETPQGIYQPCYVSTSGGHTVSRETFCEDMLANGQAVGYRDTLAALYGLFDGKCLYKEMVQRYDKNYEKTADKVADVFLKRSTSYKRIESGVYFDQTCDLNKCNVKVIRAFDGKCFGVWFSYDVINPTKSYKRDNFFCEWGDKELKIIEDFVARLCAKGSGALCDTYVYDTTPYNKGTNGIAYIFRDSVMVDNYEYVVVLCEDYGYDEETVGQDVMRRLAEKGIADDVIKNISAQFEW